MRADKKIVEFLSEYNEQILIKALQLREVVISNLPDIIEQIDMPARMIAYCYGQKYAKMICTIIPSKRRLKLGFSYLQRYALSISLFVEKSVKMFFCRHRQDYN